MPPPIASSQESASAANQEMILVEKQGLTVSLSARIDTLLREGKQLLLEWDFGDGTQSLLDSPTHTYLAAGTYAIRLSVRNILTGEPMTTASTTVAPGTAASAA